MLFQFTIEAIALVEENNRNAELFDQFTNLECILNKYS